MKTTPRLFLRGALLIFSGLLLLGSLRAQTVVFTITGGGGTPLTISWATPISYTINTAPDITNNYPAFVIEDLGNVLGGINTTAAITTTATYSRTSPTSNGPFAVTFIESGLTSGAGINPITGTDTFFFQAGGNVGANMAIGDVFILSAGSVTTTGNVSGTASSGAYTTFLADQAGRNLGIGSAIPEPSTYAAMVGAAVLRLAAWGRRFPSAG